VADLNALDDLKEAVIYNVTSDGTTLLQE
jgi:hypothetical protein